MEASQKRWYSEPLLSMSESETLMAKWLIQLGCKKNYFPWKSFPALQLAEIRNSPGMVSPLLPFCAKMDQVYSAGITALDLAGIGDHGNILVFILWWNNKIF